MNAAVRAGDGPCVLWLTRRFPRPATGGAFFYSACLVDALAPLVGRLDGVCTLDTASRAAFEAEPPRPGVGWPGVSWTGVEARPPHRLASVASLLPAEAHRWASAAYRAAVRARLAERRYDAVMLDHFGMGWLLPALAGERIVYVSHNHEASVRREVARFAGGSPSRRAYAAVDAMKAARLERRILAAARAVTAITREDLALFAEDRAGNRAETGADLIQAFLPPVPAGPGRAARVIDAATPRRVLALGSLLWGAKADSFMAFAERAGPAFTAAGLMLDVVGKAPPALEATVVLRHPWITCHGFAADPAPFLDRARIGLMLDQVGGGFKTKLLDYFFGRLPVFGFADQLAGLQGFEAGRDYVAAETLDALIAAVVDAADDLPRLNRLQESAHARATTTFTASALAHGWSGLLANLAGKTGDGALSV